MLIRLVQPSEQRAVEILTRRAFFNHFQPGAAEHFLLHKLQGHSDHIDKLYFCAVIASEIVGCIAYSKSRVIPLDASSAGSEIETCTFGPVAVLPEHRNKGIARALIQHSLNRARELGYGACIIYGDPRFYGRLGFRCAEKFDITTSEGYFSVSCMAYELIPDTLRPGVFAESKLFAELTMDDAEKYDVEQGFEVLTKGSSSMQNDFAVLVTLKYKRT